MRDLVSQVKQIAGDDGEILGVKCQLCIKVLHHETEMTELHTCQSKEKKSSWTCEACAPLPVLAQSLKLPRTWLVGLVVQDQLFRPLTRLPRCLAMDEVDEKSFRIFDSHNVATARRIRHLLAAITDH